MLCACVLNRMVSEKAFTASSRECYKILCTRRVLCCSAVMMKSQQYLQAGRVGKIPDAAVVLFAATFFGLLPACLLQPASNSAESEVSARFAYGFWSENGSPIITQSKSVGDFIWTPFAFISVTTLDFELGSSARLSGNHPTRPAIFEAAVSQRTSPQ